MVSYNEIWDDLSLKKKITENSNYGECYEKLSLLSIENIINIHFKVAKIGRTKKTGVRSEKHLTRIYNEFQNNVEMRIDIIYIVTKIMKDIVHFRPFMDVNRRTLFETGQTILRICGLEISMSEKEAIKFKTTLRPMSFKEVYKIIQDKARSIS